MEEKDILVIAEEFHNDPGAREKADGPNAGTIFYSDLLEPRFKRALSEGYLLKIDLDGVFGYPSSFVSESFGSLSLKFGSEIVLKHLRFKSDRRPIRIDKIINEINKPENFE